MNSIIKTRKGEVVQDPPLVQKLLSHPLAGLLWLPLRIWLGYQWFVAGSHKISNPAWVVTGDALKGFWTNAVKVSAETGKGPITFDWYRSFLQFMLDNQAYTWFAKLVAYGELLIGIALILGAFTGIAAFFGGFMNFNFMLAGSASTNPLLFVVAVGLILGAFTGIAAFFGGFMNFNFMLAGSASTNPLLFVIAVGLIMAWKVSGYFGADYYLLRWIGTPWHGKRDANEGSKLAASAPKPA